MKEMITFSFFIPNQPEGKAKQNLSQFLQQLAASKIKLRAISASADQRRFKNYCAPEDKRRGDGDDLSEAAFGPMMVAVVEEIR